MDLFHRLHYRTIHESYDSSVALDSVCALGFWMAVTAAVDIVVAKRFVGRYFALHTIMNLCVNVLLNWKDTVLFFRDPLNTAFCSSTGSCASLHPMIVTNAVHLLHIIVHYQRLTATDWIHHIPAMLICTWACLHAYGPAFNACNINGMGTHKRKGARARTHVRTCAQESIHRHSRRHRLRAPHLLQARLACLGCRKECEQASERLDARTVRGDHRIPDRGCSICHAAGFC